MATSQMVQLYVEQYVSGLVKTVYALQEEAFLLLDPNKDTVIRELAAQERGGVFASNFPSAFPIGFTSRVFAEVKLLSPKGETDTMLYAPSHVPSLGVLHAPPPTTEST